MRRAFPAIEIRQPIPLNIDRFNLKFQSMESLGAPAAACYVADCSTTTGNPRESRYARPESIS
jgi:hypothetical protein